MPAHTIASIFEDDDIRERLALFSDTEFATTELSLFDKNGKPYLTCLATDKDRAAKPEEVVRQLWLRRLMNHYGYPKARLRIELPITFGRDTSKRADIVILDKDRPGVFYLIIEVKKTKLKDGREQLKSYCHGTGAPLALWSDGETSVAWHRKNPNYFVEIPDIPAANQTIEEIADQPWTIATLEGFAAERERDGDGRSLKQIILDIEDEVLANAGVDVFEEVFKLIFTKLYDELQVETGRYAHLRFRNTNTSAELSGRIQKLFADACAKWEGVFLKDDRIKLVPDHLQVCVGSLEKYKLFNSNLDIIDDAFEYLINKSSKGEKGQYFTPRWVIDMCVKMLNPKLHETLIDTACGSAGFTMHSIFHVWRELARSRGRSGTHLLTATERTVQERDYVQDKVFAIDFDEKSVRVARCLNLIAGDGQSNVLHLNTLDWKRWDEWFKQEDWHDTYYDGWRKMKKLMAGRGNDYRQFKFDVLMANPPFAGDIKQPDMLAPYELATKENGKLEKAVGRDLLFIERNLDFLKPGGRMAVVLPQGRFNNSSDRRIRAFIAERCRILAVIGLDGNTFKPHTGTKTSVLLVQKWNDDPLEGPPCPRPENGDYNIFFATQRLPAKDSSGEKLIAVKDGKPLRDRYGHYVVQHDLFNHEGETQDGIAEAFVEFAKKEQLSFF
ncbi:MAG: N-6 DNA methylase [Anaerolineae bacterium]|nr:N-6 DNA methylase [Anaerolineae bacterium]